MILVVGWCSVQAGDGNRVGTAGAQELLIPVGSRGVAMGGSVVANSSGVDAIHWNPAGLGFIYEGTQAMFSHQSYIADIDIEYVAAATNIEDFGVVGLSIKVVDIGEIEETTEAFPNGTGSTFNPTMTVMGLTWAKPLTSNVNFGFTGKWIKEKIFDVEASGFALDFGFVYQSRYKGLSFGFVMKNYGPNMKFTGAGFDNTYEDVGKRPVSSDNAAFELPTSINLGLSYDFLGNGPSAAIFSGNFRANNQADDYWQGGLEYGYDEKYFIRGGYKYSVQEGFIYGASFGAGLVFPIGESSISFEYSWAETDEVFDDNQFFTVGVEF
jgi:hypothetical protein